MGLKPLGEWSPWRIALVAIAWMLVLLVYMAVRTALTGLTTNDGLDTYYIVVHLHHPRLMFLGPPVLLVALWLWQRRASRPAA